MAEREPELTAGPRTIEVPRPLSAEELDTLRADADSETHEIDLETKDPKEMVTMTDLREDMGLSDNIDPLRALLNAPIGPPIGQWACQRLSSTFAIRALTSREYNDVQDQATRWNRNRRTGRVERDLDANKLSLLICSMGTTSPNFRDPQLLQKYGKTSGQHHEVVEVALLPGEIEALATEILDLSGFDNELEEQGKD